MDADSLKALAPVHGLVFLFKWTPDPDAPPHDPDPPPGLWFARQVATNACATQAILGVLLNAAGVSLGDGPAAALKDFCAGGLPPDVAGMALAASDAIRTAHNAFTPPTPLLPDDRSKDGSGDAFHFVAYVPHSGAVWELDGLRPGPVRVADGVEEGGWLDAVAPVLAARVARYAASEVRFNLMAVVGDRLDAARERLAAVEAGGGDDGAVAAARDAVDAAAAARQRWQDDNARRKHNAIPFAFALLHELAGKGELGPFIERAERPR